MGRKSTEGTARSRSEKRARERRQELRRLIATTAGAAIVLIAAIALIYSGVGATHSARPGDGSRAGSKSIDGIPCQAEDVTYHEHAHLTILVRGKQVEVPEAVGHSRSGQCLYWLHTHDAFGIIHIEAPHKLLPTLGQFFDVWGQPLSFHRVASGSVRSGEQMKTYVNQRAYASNPRLVRLHPHTDITIEIGPPFSAPAKYRFDSGY